MDRNKWIIDLGDLNSIWCTDEVKKSSIPSMIVADYIELRTMCREGNVYGSLLQLRDLYEGILKVPVLMAFITLNSEELEENDTYISLVKKLLSKPLAMGDWASISRFLVKKCKSLNIPDSIIKILDKTNQLYGVKITDSVKDIVNWRNSSIGHGLLKFQDDEDYQLECRTLIENLREYFYGNGKFSVKDLYDNTFFVASGNSLSGIGGIEVLVDEIELSVDNNIYEINPYVYSQDLSPVFFDSYYAKKGIFKYSNYYSGKNHEMYGGKLQTVANKYLGEKLTEESVSGKFISRDKEIIMECLVESDDYIRPDFIVEKIQDTMDEIGKGIILVQMDRGTGKSVLAHYLDGMYNAKPLIDHSVIRSYHISNMHLRGFKDFLNAFNNNFKRNYDSSLDIRESDIDDFYLNEESTPEDMADALSEYHDYYEEDYTALVIDGIDEIKDAEANLFDYLPNSDCMEEGTFIILLSRYEDEETVLGESKQYISHAKDIADRVIEINREEAMFENLLSCYIDKYESNISIDDKLEIIKKADNRFLFLKAYLPLSRLYDVNSIHNEDELIKAYMEYILAHYDKKAAREFKQFCLMLCINGALSISDYCESVGGNEVTYRLVGIINDLLPVMTVYHLDGESYYSFANESYADFVIKSYSEVICDLLHHFQDKFCIIDSDITKYIENASECNKDAEKKDLEYADRISRCYENIFYTWFLIKQYSYDETCFYNNEIFMDILAEYTFFSKKEEFLLRAEVNRWQIDEWIKIFFENRRGDVTLKVKNLIYRNICEAADFELIDKLQEYGLVKECIQYNKQNKQNKYINIGYGGDSLLDLLYKYSQGQEKIDVLNLLIIDIISNYNYDDADEETVNKVCDYIREINSLNGKIEDLQGNIISGNVINGKLDDIFIEYWNNIRLSKFNNVKNAIGELINNENCDAERLARSLDEFYSDGNYNENQMKEIAREIHNTLKLFAEKKDFEMLNQLLEVCSHITDFCTSLGFHFERIIATCYSAERDEYRENIVFWSEFFFGHRDQEYYFYYFCSVAGALAMKYLDLEMYDKAKEPLERMVYEKDYADFEKGKIPFVGETFALLDIYYVTDEFEKFEKLINNIIYTIEEYFDNSREVWCEESHYPSVDLIWIGRFRDRCKNDYNISYKKIDKMVDILSKNNENIFFRQMSACTSSTMFVNEFNGILLPIMDYRFRNQEYDYCIRLINKINTCYKDFLEKHIDLNELRYRNRLIKNEKNDVYYESHFDEYIEFINYVGNSGNSDEEIEMDGFFGGNLLSDRVYIYISDKEQNSLHAPVYYKATFDCDKEFWFRSRQYGYGINMVD